MDVWIGNINDDEYKSRYRDFKTTDIVSFLIYCTRYRVTRLASLTRPSYGT